MDVQQSSRTRGTDSIGDAICLMVLQLLGSNLESGDRAPIVRNEINSRSCDEKRIYIKFYRCSTRRLLVVEFFNSQNPNCKGIKFC